MIKKLSIILFCWMLIAGCSLSEISQVINDVTEGEKPLSEGEIIKGLKEALTVGISNGAGKVSASDGYFKNVKIKLPFPPDAQNVADKLRSIGLGGEVDKVILSLNRAAEEAAKEAKPIFVSAIKQMTIRDGMQILKGDDDAATQYLKRTTSDQLRVKFRPVIETALQTVNATKYWADVMGTYNKIPLVKKVETDLAGFVTERALDGLFFMIAAEEKKIREDPLARVSEILKRVFGYEG
ncbi:MAG: DUF4197 domain-containing protein [Bacteroidetes bacterium]|nr:DUF4197 domain-containing protein [Bacteroidota bacterium]